MDWFLYDNGLRHERVEMQHHNFFKFIQSNKDHAFPKTKFHVQDTKKLNCPASITLRDIAFFPDFKVRYVNCVFSLFLWVFSPSFFIISCKMNLENKFSYKKIARLNLAVLLQKAIHSIQFDVINKYLV